MTDLIDVPVEAAKGVYGMGKDQLQESTLYAGVLGLGAASLLGATFIMLPFEKLPYGKFIRTASLVLGGAALVGWSRDQDADVKAAGTMAGTVMAAAGMIKAASDLGIIRIPGAKTVSGLVGGGGTGAFGAEDTALMDDRNVIGQDGATYDTRPIAEPGDDPELFNDELTEGVEEMVGRYAPQERVPMDSVIEGSTMAGTITQNFGAEQQSSGWFNPNRDLKMNEFVDATDAMAQGKMDDNSNPFVASVHPVSPAYQPPVWYAEDEMMVSASLPSLNAATIGGLPDVLGSYIVPGSSGNAFLDSVAMSSAGQSGHGVIQNYGAEVFY
tara:strand:- start:785 stop:1765 length:981 start_codon:yes stop_codon:yes gene_type:complete